MVNDLCGKAAREKMLTEEMAGHKDDVDARQQSGSRGPGMGTAGQPRHSTHGPHEGRTGTLIAENKCAILSHEVTGTSHSSRFSSAI